AVLSWFSSLARGRSPRGLRDFVAWALGYTAQVYAYLLLLTDRYPNTNPQLLLGGLEAPDAAGRPRIANTDDLRRSRLLVFFRLPLAVPHIVCLALWSIVVVLVSIVNWLVTLIRGTPSAALARFLSAYVR